MIVVGGGTRAPAVAIRDAETLTAHGRNLHLRVAIDYSGRDAIVRAARALVAEGSAGATPGGAITREALSQAIGRVDHDPTPARDVDLLVRTGGEQRLSDFLLWECAYAELYFSDVLWPDFAPATLDAALAEFARRTRRFGR